jgi:hypothetical protein
MPDARHCKATIDASRSAEAKHITSETDAENFRAMEVDCKKWETFIQRYAHVTIVLLSIPYRNILNFVRQRHVLRSTRCCDAETSCGTCRAWLIVQFLIVLLQWQRLICHVTPNARGGRLGHLLQPTSRSERGYPGHGRLRFSARVLPRPSNPPTSTLLLVPKTP